MNFLGAVQQRSLFPLHWQGKYFNKIVEDPRTLRKGTLLNQVLEWIATLHGYLSSPTGGGVRHGADLSQTKRCRFRRRTPAQSQFGKRTRCLMTSHVRLALSFCFEIAFWCSTP